MLKELELKTESLISWKDPRDWFRLEEAYRDTERTKGLRESPTKQPVLSFFPPLRLCASVAALGFGRALEQLELDCQVFLRVLAKIVNHFYAFGRQLVHIVIERLVGD